MQRMHGTMAHGEGHDSCMAHERAHDRAADVRRYAAVSWKVWLTEQFYHSWRGPTRDAQGEARFMYGSRRGPVDNSPAPPNIDGY